MSSKVSEENLRGSPYDEGELQDPSKIITPLVQALIDNEPKALNENLAVGIKESNFYEYCRNVYKLTDAQIDKEIKLFEPPFLEIDGEKIFGLRDLVELEEIWLEEHLPPTYANKEAGVPAQKKKRFGGELAVDFPATMRRHIKPPSRL